MTELDTLSGLRPAGAVGRPTRAASFEHGEKVRRRIPFGVIAEHGPTADRDAVGLLESQASTRVQELLPIRYGRMADSPFAFYRGAALVMAHDLAHAPTTGLYTQLCGDAHLSNFGLFATPERELAFDLNDFDETYPGPFEWDLKRLVASLAVAGRDNGFTGKQRKRIARACAAEYRETMTYQANRGELAVCYAHIDATAQLDELRDVLDSSTRKRVQKTIRKSWGRDSMQALSKLTTMHNGQPRIVSAPPLIAPLEEILSDTEAAQINRELVQRLREYRDTLEPARRVLFDRFEYVQTARKVVGVGSVGTRAWIILLVGPGGDPLFLQAKEAGPSVLSGYLEGPSYPNQGERVVAGQRVIQAASDILLGWQQGPDVNGTVRDYYVRQLRDGKGSAVIETMSADLMALYGRLCARVVAFAHARAGDRFAIAGYLGSDDDFDKALTEFAETYADQNARDHAALLEAIADGRITAHRES
ncbi:hypothetical protein BTZ20_3824 [Rhodococcus sp. MTM3W5.2]|uniref:DUF2252 domain-containing protein n=1 Tax=Rhodococcus sp. MTM3W5.2 TaxID=1805827 RepID=UPI00097979C4|nr:DUF2252 domain-containing protein [Rhodococcus sp. MTM3W5.2]AQA25763.1 hypothetical protein BTZ20_3824 [Rhodococcus sp. MTM3W5.2]